MQTAIIIHVQSAPMLPSTIFLFENLKKKRQVSFLFRIRNLTLRVSDVKRKALTKMKISLSWAETFQEQT